MDAKQLKQVILNHFKKEFPGAPAEDVYWDSQHEGFFDKPTEVSANVVVIEPVESQTGGEDKFAGGVGDVYHILKVTIDGGSAQYFKLAGTYRSYDGSEWSDEWVEVKPKQKTVTVFE